MQRTADVWEPRVGGCIQRHKMRYLPKRYSSRCTRSRISLLAKGIATATGREVNRTREQSTTSTRSVQTKQGRLDLNPAVRIQAQRTQQAQRIISHCNARLAIRNVSAINSTASSSMPQRLFETEETHAQGEEDASHPTVPRYTSHALTRRCNKSTALRSVRPRIDTTYERNSNENGN